MYFVSKTVYMAPSLGLTVAAAFDLCDLQKLYKTYKLHGSSVHHQLCPGCHLEPDSALTHRLRPHTQTPPTHTDSAQTQLFSVWVW